MTDRADHTQQLPQQLPQPYVPSYGGFSGPSGPPPGSPMVPTEPHPRGRKGFVAGVLAASLLVGGGAGLGGAALWDLVDDDPATGGSSTTTARVVDQGDPEAPAGSVQEVAAAVLPSVVKIEVASAQGAGAGSGIVLSSDGVILTNEHVVSGAGEGASIRVDFSDGTHAPATVLGTDPLTDTAVIRAEGVSDLTPATIGSSDNLDVGEGVVAIGSPFGLDSTVTSGIVSALDRPVNVGSDSEGNATVYPAIQTDAAINPGNSGGALVDMTGAVVGINASIRSTTAVGGEAGSIGLGFAIPIDSVMPIIEQLQAGEEATHARLGITVGDVGAPGQPGRPGEESAQPEQAREDGALVNEVGPDSAAATAGLEPGDVITGVDDTHVTSADSLIATIRAYRPGDEVTVTYVRDGEERTTRVTLESD